MFKIINLHEYKMYLFFMLQPVQILVVRYSPAYNCYFRITIIHYTHIFYTFSVQRKFAKNVLVYIYNFIFT